MLRPRRGGRWVVWGGDACVAHGTNFRLERRVARTTPELRQASTQAWQSDPSYSRVDPGGQPGGGRARATCVVRRPRPDPGLTLAVNLAGVGRGPRLLVLCVAPVLIPG